MASFHRRLPHAEGGEADKWFAGTISRAEALDKGEPIGVLDFHIPDFGVPEWGAEVWIALAADIEIAIDAGIDVLIACMGGHGRTGMAISILSYLLDIVPKGEDPILWTRNSHCQNAVESDKQIFYVYETLGLPDNPQVKTPKKHTYNPKVTGEADKKGGGSTTIGKNSDKPSPIVDTIWTEFLNRLGGNK